MRNNIFPIILSIHLLTLPLASFSQGWVAEVDIQIDHYHYAQSRISSATLSFSGVSVTGSSSSNTLRLTATGSTPISGVISLSILGIASNPYDPIVDPTHQPISVVFLENYSTPCVTGYFQKKGESQWEQASFWIRIYPRMEISKFVNECDKITLSTNTCAASLFWEVSESITGEFKVIPSKSTASMTITRDELKALGFANVYGRKYFRVTGRSNTSSEVEPIDIYYPAPLAVVTPTPPRCHGGTDGTVKLDITRSFPSIINDFVLTIFPKDSPTEPVKQDYLQDGFSMTMTGLAAGDYLVIVENNSTPETYGPCKAEFDFKVADPEAVAIPDATISNTNGYAIRCSGGSDGKIEVHPSGGTGTYSTYQWTPAISTTQEAKDLSQGVYNVKVQDSGGCWSEPYTYTLSEPKKLSVTLTSTGGKDGYDVSCLANKDGKIETTVSGGVPQYSFQWSDGTSDPLKQKLAPGHYSIIVTDANDCAVSESIELKAPKPIDFTIAEITGITCPGAHSGVLEIQSPVNTIGDISYLWSSGEKLNAITDKPKGTYTATVTDAQGCSKSKPHTLIEPASWTMDISIKSDYHGSAIKCNNDHNGILAVTVWDEKGNAASADEYKWFKNGVEFTSGPDIAALDELEAGIYTAQITYNSLCKIKKTAVLEEPGPVQASISIVSNYHGVPISCNGRMDASIRAAASGGTGNTYTYKWTTGETIADLTGLGAGTYTVIASDTNGCAGVAETVLKDPALLEVSIAIKSDYYGQAISCVGASDARIFGSVKGGTPPLSYAWNSRPSQQDLINIPAGQYIFTATDENDCTGVAEITIADPRPVQAKIARVSDYHGYGVSCYGKNDGYILAEGSGGTQVYDYQWHETATFEPLNANLKSGQYTVTVSDENGCSDTETWEISEPGILTLGIANTKHVSCNKGDDGAVQLAAIGGAQGYEYAISGHAWQSLPSLQELKAGAYEFITRDSNGCSAIVSETVMEPAPLQIHFDNIEAALCGDPRGKVSASAEGGTGEYRYLWMNAQNTIIGKEPYISELPAGIFSLTVTDEHFCALTEAVGITSTDGPTVEVREIIPSTCSYTADGRAMLEVTDGEAPYSFLWSDGQTTSEASNLARGEHWIEVKDSNDCIAVETVSISAPDTLEMQLLEKKSPTCHGDCDGKILVAAKGGNGNYTYTWKNFTGPSLERICAGQYEVTVVDQKQCVAIKTITLEQPDLLRSRLLHAQSPSCPEGCDGKIDIEGSGGTGILNYAWSGGTTGYVLQNACAGDHTATITDQNNCTITTTYSLDEAKVRSIDLGGAITLCAGQTHLLDAGPNWQSYSWKGSSGFTSSERRITISEAGMYSLEARTLKGCTVRDTFLLQTSSDLLKANFLLATQAFTGDTVVMIDISWPVPEYIQWNFPKELILLNTPGEIAFGQFENPGSYQVSLTTTLGACRDVLSKTITISDGKNVAEEGRLGINPYVKEFDLYPNPNDGLFEVVVHFVEESPMLLTIWNVLTSKKIGQVQDSGNHYYRKQIDLRPLSAGSYALRLDYGKGTKNIRFIVR